MQEYLFVFGSFVVKNRVRKLKISRMISVQQKSWMEQFNVLFQFARIVGIIVMIIYVLVQFLGIKISFPYSWFFVQSGGGS